jgi:hypothetical protein
MNPYPAARPRPVILFLMALGLGAAWTGPGARVGRAAENEGPAATAATAGAPGTARTRGDEEGEEGATVEIDPVLRLQLLSAILITSPDALGNPTGSGGSGVPRAPGTSSVTGGGGLPGSSSGGSHDPVPGSHDAGNAPEPASLVLGALGTGLALLSGYRRRRRTTAVA